MKRLFIKLGSVALWVGMILLAVAPTFFLWPPVKSPPQARHQGHTVSELLSIAKSDAPLDQAQFTAEQWPIVCEMRARWLETQRRHRIWRVKHPEIPLE